MATPTQPTTTAPAVTGADQNILNKLNSTGQNPFNDLTLFNSNRVDKLMSNYATDNPEKVTGVQVSKTNMPNSSQASIDLANQVFKLNDQAYNTNAQNIAIQANKSLSTLSQQVKDQNAQALQLFGQASLLSPEQSSRNRSYVTDIGVQGEKVAQDIRNQAQMQLSQLALGYAQSNVNALTQARQLDLQDQQASLQREQFDFNKAVTEAGLTGNYLADKDSKPIRTLQGLQFDQNTINNRLNQALTLSSLTGRMPDLTDISGSKFDLSKQLDNQLTSNQYTLQGQSSQIGLEGAKAQLLQTRASLGLDTTGLSTNLLPSGVLAGWKLPEDSLLAEQNKAALYSAQAEAQKAKYILDSYAGMTGVSGQMATLVTQAEDYSKQYKTLLNSDNPDESQVKTLMEKWDKTSKQLADYQGSGNGIYYNAAGSRTLDKNGVPTIDYSPGTATDADGKTVETNKYIAGSLAKSGFDGNAQFKALGNSSLNTQMPAIQAEFSKEILSAITSGNSANTINKLVYSNNTGDQVILGIRQPGENGKPGNTYQFQQLDMSGMSAVDKAKFQNALSSGVTIDGKTVTDNTVAGLQNLQNLIQQYSSKNNLKLQPLYASDVVNKLKTDSNYSEVASNTIYNDGKLQLNNTQLLPMILTGATDGGKALINSDFGGNQLSNMLVNYNSFYSKAKEQGLSDQAVSLFVGNPKEFPALPDGTPNPFTNSGNQSAVGNLSSWYNSMATQANQGQANQYTRAFMSAYTPTNGNDISDSFILSLVNAKTIPAGVGASQTIKDIQNMYGTNLNAAMTQLFNQLANQ